MNATRMLHRHALHRPLMRALSLALLGLVAACSGAEDGDIATWMAEQRSSIKPSVTPVAEPKKFDPAPYEAAEKTDPFSTAKLGGGFKPDATVPEVSSELLRPELSRRKEVLEAFPLDAMSMVGTLQKESKKVALVRVNQLLYQVDVNAYLGQNYGKVTAITDNAINLREIVQETSGEWIERSATLELQEGKK